MYYGAAYIPVTRRIHRGEISEHIREISQQVSIDFGLCKGDQIGISDFSAESLCSIEPERLYPKQLRNICRTYTVGFGH